MLNKKIFLTENEPDVYLETFVACPLKNFTRDAILVIPGGGYEYCSADREGEAVAEAFMPYGYNAFVLQYSLGEKARFPKPLIEASLAMKHIRDNAEEYGINKNRVFVVGFSAGGHLCAALGTLWHTDEIYKAVDMPFGYNRPTGIMPIYPVISSDESIWHAGSIRRVNGLGLTPENPDKYSLERAVDERTVPTFLTHSSNDSCVKVQNSLVFAAALAENKIPFEMHIFPKGSHGWALGNELTFGGNDAMLNPHMARWVDLAAEWAMSVESSEL